MLKKMLLLLIFTYFSSSQSAPLYNNRSAFIDKAIIGTSLGLMAEGYYGSLSFSCAPKLLTKNGLLTLLLMVGLKNLWAASEDVRKSNFHPQSELKGNILHLFSFLPLLGFMFKGSFDLLAYLLL
jgi:hypothetical protein